MGHVLPLEILIRILKGALSQILEEIVALLSNDTVDCFNGNAGFTEVYGSEELKQGSAKAEQMVNLFAE
ncbi:hypothetical protein AMTRI_Chr06g194970 [Amborella trichopoda]